MVKNWPLLFRHAAVTLEEMILGILFAVLISFPVTWLMVLYRRFAEVMQAMLVIIQCVPVFILAPIMVTMFGFSKLSIIVPTVIMIIFPFALTLYKGLCNVPQSLVNYFTFHRASEWDKFWKLRVPYTVSYLISGLKLACSIAGVGAIAGEWAGAQEGLGVFIQETRRSFDLDGVFSGVFILVSMSLILYNLINLLNLRKYQFEKFS